MIKASDSSISVRDAVLEFISKLIFTPPPFETDPTDLIQSVLSRIKVNYIYNESFAIIQQYVLYIGSWSFGT